MTNIKRQTLGVILLMACAGGCSDRTSPAGPTQPSSPSGPAPAPVEPRLIAFIEQGTGFSTTDLHDAENEILQINSRQELIWLADGTRIPGYSADVSHAIDGVPVYWISGAICSSDCAFEIRFGAQDGQRRAYLTVDYGHDNPGTVVDVEVVQGQLVVTQTDTYPPGSPMLSGVVYEQTPSGQVPVEGATIAISISSGWRYGITDTTGHYEVRGLFDGGKAVHVTKDGYLEAKAFVPISGDTVLDVPLVRR